MKELMQSFEGKGEVSGFRFRQIANTSAGYIYEVRHQEVKKPHYEVFKRRMNHRFQLISYPRANAFGVWAWTYPTLEMARQKLEKISQAKNKLDLPPATGGFALNNEKQGYPPGKPLKALNRHCGKQIL
jgi:hypothetical protein